LARLEEQAGHLEQAIAYLEMARKVSPNAVALARQINELKDKLAAPRPSPAPGGR